MRLSYAALAQPTMETVNFLSRFFFHLLPSPVPHSTLSDFVYSAKLSPITFSYRIVDVDVDVEEETQLKFY